MQRARDGSRSGRVVLWSLAALLLATPVLAAAFPSALRIPRREGKGTPALPAALFSHRTHGSFGCFACHPGTFPQAPLAFTHQDMNQGRYCGRCHDGLVAFAIAGRACAGCHVAPP